jgi:hypothetical protein
MTTATSGNTAATDPTERIAVLEKKALLSALWLFVLLNLIFRDLHEIVKAEVLEELLTGTYNGRKVTEVMFLLGGILIEVGILMTLMTWVLPPRANRSANVIVAPLFALTFIASPGDLDDYFHVGLAVIALGIIGWQAWRWKPSPS